MTTHATATNTVVKPWHPQTRIGWIGTGVMGQAMAGHLLAAGHLLTVFNRTEAKTRPLLERGAVWASSPRQVATASEVIFTIVGFPEDVREVVLGTEGTLAGAAPGSVLIDMTTSSPTLAVEIAEKAAARQVASLDIPVSGGDVGARQATLSLFVGGNEAVFAAMRPGLSLLGKTLVYHGGPGAGQHAKLVNQILIAGNMIGVCEGLLYARRAGLNPLKVLESVGSGAAGSWSINHLGPRMLAGDYAPGFLVDHFLKDLGLALAEAKRLQLPLPGLALANQLYLATQAHGHGRKGTQALLLALEALAGARP